MTHTEIGAEGVAPVAGQPMYLRNNNKAHFGESGVARNASACIWSVDVRCDLPFDSRVTEANIAGKKA